MPTPLTTRRSPFKFLNPYDKRDHAIFFGREEEESVLYEAVNKNRLVLVYGPSGAGKTSLVKCGLTNRFEVTDWLPFLIRRGQDINESLLRALSQSRAMGGQALTVENIAYGIDRISSRYLRPIYLIFDQFEELLIMGGQEEKARFFRLLDELVHSPRESTCHLLFILREEYFAWLEPFEKQIPGFTDRRVRVEPMRPKRVKEVIMKSCAAFNMTLAQPEANAQQIIQSLSGKSGISLPYLQVYLDLLWRACYTEQHPTGWEGDGYPPLRVTRAVLDDLGAIEDVLERFLMDRRRLLRREIDATYPLAPADTIPRVLDAFVTEEGTKRPIRYRLVEEEIVLEQPPEALAGLDQGLSAFCLRAFEENRLIRSDGDTFELAHDSLAALIDQQRTDEQRQRNEIKRRIQNAFRDFEDTGQMLTRRQLNLYEEYLPSLRLDEGVRQFVDDSRREVVAQEARAEKEARAKRRRMLIQASSLLLLVFTAAITWAFYQAYRSNINFRQEEARRVTYELRDMASRIEHLQEATAGQGPANYDESVFVAFQDKMEQIGVQYGNNRFFRDSLLHLRREYADVPVLRTALEQIIKSR